MNPVLRHIALAGTILLGCSGAGAASDRFADVTVETEALRGGVHMLRGAGGNIGVLATDAGMLMVDDQYAPLAERIQAALDGISTGGPRFVVNTHFHGDHTGGNPFFGRAGTILAHENVRVRLLDGGEMPPRGLPAITYADRIRLHLGEETIDLVHLPRGHTDGDSVVYFRAANVVHTGDVLFNKRFPYIDIGSGGSVQGMIDNVATILEQVDEGTIIIPGHGPLADLEDLLTYQRMLRETYEQVAAQVAGGRTDAQIKARGVAEEWSDWGWRFITEERWLDTLIAQVRSAGGD